MTQNDGTVFDPGDLVVRNKLDTQLVQLAQGRDSGDRGQFPERFEIAADECNRAVAVRSGPGRDDDLVGREFLDVFQLRLFPGITLTPVSFSCCVRNWVTWASSPLLGNWLARRTRPQSSASRSISVTSRPRSAAMRAASMPPGPPPITSTFRR